MPTSRFGRHTLTSCPAFLDTPAIIAEKKGSGSSNSFSDYGDGGGDDNDDDDDVVDSGRLLHVSEGWSVGETGEENHFISIT
jgi:hypothetical protein